MTTTTPESVARGSATRGSHARGDHYSRVADHVLHSGAPDTAPNISALLFLRAICQSEIETSLALADDYLPEGVIVEMADTFAAECFTWIQDECHSRVAIILENEHNDDSDIERGLTAAERNSLTGAA